MCFRVFARLFLGLLALSVLGVASLFAQTDTASLSGTVVDPQGRPVPEVEVQATRSETGITTVSPTNSVGIFFFSSLAPGRYQLVVTKTGFKEIVAKGLTLQVGGRVEQNFTLQLGSQAESVTVEGSALEMNTTDATVSTVVDRKFADNLPLNGRSFQSLIELAPGVIPTAGSGNTDTFVVNGQRETSNYWTVDGVSANFGIGGNIGNPGAGLGGQTSATSLSGGTNSLVSVDALQEFRIETSTAAPDSGLTAGGQISIVTRSGTNQFHGSLFDYLRNDVLDANDWFNGVNTFNPTPLPKAEERQNDFGGTFGGPIQKDRTFFFFSYEGLRLRLPQTALTQVPDSTARQSAIPAIQQFLNAYPVAPAGDDLGNGVALFNTTFSNPSALDAYSLRIDERLTDKLNLFGRYNYSPSSIAQYGFGPGSGVALSQKGVQSETIQTFTAGTTWSLSPSITNDFRFNYSRLDSTGASVSSNFGGATPITSLPLPNGFNLQNANLGFQAGFTTNGYLDIGAGEESLQRQIELVDNFAVQKGVHRFAFGVDYRRLSPRFAPAQYSQYVQFNDYPSTEAGIVASAFANQNIPATFLFRTFSLFAQDSWQLKPRFTVTYGLRWGVEFPPKTVDGPPFPALENFSTSDYSEIVLAPLGTPAYETNYGNVSPRVGVAYQLLQKNGAPSTVLRGGFGLYDDLAAGAAGNLVAYAYPYTGYGFYAGSQLPVVYPATGGTFPLAPAYAAPPAIVPPGSANSGLLLGFNPHFETPYTLEWNVALQQQVGRQQSLTVSYVGAAGRRLVQTIFPYNSPPPSYPGGIGLFDNGGSSSYNALQAQFQRQVSHGLQALVSYTWAHSIDTGSTVFGQGGQGISDNRGPSKFDIRNMFSTALTYDIPAYRPDRFVGAILSGWSLQSIVKAYSSPPVDVTINTNQSFTEKPVYVRPDVLPGVPLCLYGPQYPGGKILNNTPDGPNMSCVGPFCFPPTDANGNILRQGDLGRNALRGFPASQWDFAVHRDFPIRELWKLQFRAEMFNVLNHPNFAPPYSALNLGFGSNAQFGYSLETLGQYLGGNSSGGGALSPLYQFGGPRSIQLALKLSF
jgi:Carboxypeptidase regulatory-like domain/TonB dependent receptor